MEKLYCLTNVRLEGGNERIPNIGLNTCIVLLTQVAAEVLSYKGR